VHADVAGKLDVGFEDLGEQQVKNISRPVRVFRAQLGTRRPAAATPTLALPDKPVAGGLAVSEHDR
jgi:adenylate cyclase